jgi:hypothetical protein
MVCGLRNNMISVNSSGRMAGRVYFLLSFLFAKINQPSIYICQLLSCTIHKKITQSIMNQLQDYLGYLLKTMQHE